MKNLEEIFKQNGIILTKTQQNLFDSYFSLLIETNKKFNLTAITDEDEVVVKHFLDSVLPYAQIKKNASVVDVGSGAGFPAIPLKILRPDISICMVDSLQKRVNFLNDVVKTLNLLNSRAVHARAEDFAHLENERERFDIAVARAVAPLSTLVEYLLPLVKISGKVIAYKSTKLDEELAASENAIKILGGKVEKVDFYTIKSPNFEDFSRKILILQKISHSPSKYPRSKNLPKTHPLT